jgi:prepilin-type N-terminal cleavage/methylation domain-containing protein
VIKKYTQRGDTIVEVLVAIAVLTVILTGAYITARRGQDANQASQERSTAVGIIQTQIEGLKALITKGTPGVPSAGAFCVNTAQTGFTPITTDPFSQSLAATTFPFDNDCGNVINIYNVALEPLPSSTTTYQIMVRWDRFNGGRDQIIMYDRIN